MNLDELDFDYILSALKCYNKRINGEIGCLQIRIEILKAVGLSDIAGELVVAQGELYDRRNYVDDLHLKISIFLHEEE